VQLPGQLINVNEIMQEHGLTFLDPYNVTVKHSTCLWLAYFKMHVWCHINTLPQVCYSACSRV